MGDLQSSKRTRRKIPQNCIKGKKDSQIADLHLNNFRRRERASVDAALNAALVDATLDQEMAAIAPLLVPAVLNLPVINTVEGAVADQGDGMASQERAGLVGVHAGLVRREITVNAE